MPKALGSRLTYANVMATVAVFLALGGGAYALTGIPDRSGVYHGCVDVKVGALRVVKSASACRKAKTVRRAGRRVRIPGESAIAWNQQGLRGLQGIQGTTGLKGDKGDKGDQGVVGPAQGFAAQKLAGAGPSNTPDGIVASTTVATPSSGKLFVFARGVANVPCTAGASVQLGLYVDGVPVSASGQPATAATDTEVATWGLSDTVGAGTHSVALRPDCTGGNSGSIVFSGDGALGGIFVGA